MDPTHEQTVAPKKLTRRFLDWLESGPIALYGNPATDGVTLYKDRVERGRETFPLAGVSARVESGQELSSRVTVTRLLAIGLFAFAAKKKSGGEVYLTIEGPGFFWSLEVNRKKQSAARKFAAAVNNQARAATEGETND